MFLTRNFKNTILDILRFLEFSIVIVEIVLIIALKTPFPFS